MVEDEGMEERPIDGDTKGERGGNIKFQRYGPKRREKTV